MFESNSHPVQWWKRWGQKAGAGGSFSEVDPERRVTKCFEESDFEADSVVKEGMF